MRILAIGVAIVSLCGCYKAPEPGRITPSEAAFGDEWIPLTTPEYGSALAVGTAWNLSSQYVTGCFECSRIDSTAGAKSLKYRWSTSGGDTANLVFGKLVGLDLKRQGAVQGTVTLEDIEIRRGIDCGPTYGDCVVRDNTGFPTLPMITELIGARKTSFVARDQSGGSVRLDIGKPGLVKGMRTLGDTLEVDFESLRWIGVRLSTYSFVSSEGMLGWTIPVRRVVDMGEYQIRVTRDGNKFHVEWRAPPGITKWVPMTVDGNEGAVLGKGRGAPMYSILTLDEMSPARPDSVRAFLATNRGAVSETRSEEGAERLRRQIAEADARGRQR
jgi:hypothetical protein